MKQSSITKILYLMILFLSICLDCLNRWTSMCFFLRVKNHSVGSTFYTFHILRDLNFFRFEITKFSFLYKDRFTFSSHIRKIERAKHTHRKKKTKRNTHFGHNLDALWCDHFENVKVEHIRFSKFMKFGWIINIIEFPFNFFTPWKILLNSHLVSIIESIILFDYFHFSIIIERDS